MTEVDTGLLRTLKAKNPEFDREQGRHYARLAPSERRIVDGWLSKLGVSAEQCARHYSYRNAVNAAFFAALATRGTEHFIRPPSLFEVSPHLAHRPGHGWPRCECVQGHQSPQKRCEGASA